MNRIDEQSKRRKLNIVYIYNQNGKILAEILKEGYYSILNFYHKLDIGILVVSQDYRKFYL